MPAAAVSTETDSDGWSGCVQTPAEGNRSRRIMTARSAAAMMLIAAVAALASVDSAEAREPSPSRMVAIGDSYTSGEGVPPFEMHTDTIGVNQCHRSPLAYPVLVSESLGQALDSWACSGATTDDLTSRTVSLTGAPWDDPAQDVEGLLSVSALDRIGTDVAVVTITIGGNDIGFPDIVTDCLVSTKPCTSHHADVRQGLIELESSLASLITDITARLSPGGSVLVVGYPRIFPEFPHADCDFMPLLPVGVFTMAEQEWANAMTAQLNTVVANVTHQADSSEGPRFLYVDVWDAFASSELCRLDPSTGLPILASPLINAVDLTHLEHSFHPSASGHQILAGRVLDTFGVYPMNGDSIALVESNAGLWHLRRYPADVPPFYFGDPGDEPFVGDWDCDGIETPGLYRQSDGFVYLRNANTQGVADVRFFFGNPQDVPLAGDFNGDGCDTVSVYRPSQQRFYIMNEVGENDGGIGAADYWFVFGDAGDAPVVGDWDGNGIDEVGLHRETTGLFYWRNSLTTGTAEGEMFFGDPGDRFVAGDWGIIDGRDTPAVFRPTDLTNYFRHTMSQGNADSQIVWAGAMPNWIPVAGSLEPND